MSDAKAERRAGKRVEVRVPVSIKSRGQSADLAGFTRDLNTSGVFLYTDSRINEGSDLEMVLILPPELTGGEKQWVCCRASVVRVEDSAHGAVSVSPQRYGALKLCPNYPPELPISLRFDSCLDFRKRRRDSLNRF